MNRVISRFVVASGLGVSLLAFAQTPIFAADKPAETYRHEVKTCNTTARDAIKTARDDFKAGKINRQERIARVRDAEKTRKACVKDARQKYKDARKAAREARRQSKSE